MIDLSYFGSKLWIQILFVAGQLQVEEEINSIKDLPGIQWSSAYLNHLNQI